MCLVSVSYWRMLRMCQLWRGDDEDDKDNEEEHEEPGADEDIRSDLVPFFLLKNIPLLAEENDFRPAAGCGACRLWLPIRLATTRQAQKHKQHHTWHNKMHTSRSIRFNISVPCINHVSLLHYTSTA